MSRFVRKLLLVGVLGYVGVLALAYALGVWSAEQWAGRMLDSGLKQLCADLEDGATAIVKFVGNAIIRDCPVAREVRRDSILQYKRAFAVDEINVVDGAGRFACSTEDAIAPGTDFEPSSPRRLIDYGRLLRGQERYQAEPLRSSVERPDIRRKYGAVAFPKGDGFVQIGFDEGRLLYDFDYVYDSLCTDWIIGEMSFFILTDPRTGRIVSALDRDDIGKDVFSMIPDLPKTCADDGKARKLTVKGMRCFVKDTLRYGHQAIAVVPVAEVAAMRDLMVTSVAILALVLFATFGSTMLKSDRHNRQMRKVFERERQQQDKEIRMAKAIQENALPSVFPPFPQLADRLDIFAMMIPAKEVGGDFYDFYLIGSDKLAIVIADVSGKGIPAAMFMMRAKSTLQGLLRGNADVAEAVSSTNDRISVGNEANMFVTAWVGVLNLKTGSLDYVNAGHNPPVLKRHSGEAEWLKDLSGPALAAMAGVHYRRHSVRLRPGDGVFLYTDGVTEAADRDFELFGTERLIRSFTARALITGDGKTPRKTSREFCETLMLGVRQFAGGAEQSDDITMLAVKLNGLERDFPATVEGMAAAQEHLAHCRADPKLDVIADEVVSNIVRCSGATGFSIKIQALADGVELTFADDGRPFDPTTEAPEPNITASLDQRSIGGLGIFMIKRMSRRVSYARVANRNVLTVLV